MPQPSVNWY